MAEEKVVDKPLISPGDKIKCTYNKKEVEGDVVAYHKSLLILRAPASNGKASANDVYVINTESCEKLGIIQKSENASREQNRPIDFTKLEKRRTKAIGLKRARIRALSADVAPEGRKLFLTITKTIDEVVWDNEVIVVLKDVKILPPYKVDNVQGQGDKDSPAVTHVKKIVDKHWKEAASEGS